MSIRLIDILAVPMCVGSSVKLAGQHMLVVCALVLLGAVVRCGADRPQHSADPRAGRDVGCGHELLDLLADAIRTDSAG